MQRKTGDWDCPDCSTVNFASRNECYKCKCYKSKGKTPEKKKGDWKGDWNCGCGELNFASRTNCRRCNKPKDQTTQPVQSTQNSNGIINWIFGGTSNQPSQPSQPKKPVDLTSLKPGDWLCDSCQTNNFGNRVVCFNCGKNKDKQQDDNEEKEDELCGVCLTAPTDTCISLCGHLFCNFCALNCNKCPKCRKDYTAGDLIKIYK